ncbi:MAG: hypothetical protein RL456_978 [Pseudomonadota bacterium]|jgi:glycosyltransferase involved in cell wall biosynthesis
MNATRLPLLMVAYQCGPGLGSVSQIGWEWFAGMAARCDVTLVTHIRNRDAIEQAPDRPAGAQVIYIDTEWFAGPVYRLARRLFPRSDHAVFMLSQADYFVFDAGVVRQLRHRRRDAGGTLPWRLVHMVTPVTTAAATRLPRLGLPVVRGPLNCGLAVPDGFADVMRTDAMGVASLRVLPRMLDALLGSLRDTRAVLVATEATLQAVPPAVRPRCVRMIENAVDPVRFAPADALPPPGPGRPLRVSFVGRLVPFKALHLLIDAMARLHGEGRPVTLEVAGDGPMAEAWRAHAERLGLGGAIRWLGAVPLDRVPQVMRDSHVFCLPSVRESGGAVLLEAMACARPVIGVDFGGPAEVIDEAVGWKIPAVDADTVVDGLVTALGACWTDPDDAAARGRRGAERVRAEHTWPARMDRALRLYESVLQPGDGRPHASSHPRPTAASARPAP